MQNRLTQQQEHRKPSSLMMTLEYVDNEYLLQLLAHSSMPQKLEKSLETLLHNQHKCIQWVW